MNTSPDLSAIPDDDHKMLHRQHGKILDAHTTHLALLLHDTGQIKSDVTALRTEVGNVRVAQDRLESMLGSVLEILQRSPEQRARDAEETAKLAEILERSESALRAYTGNES